MSYLRGLIGIFAVWQAGVLQAQTRPGAPFPPMEGWIYVSATHEEELADAHGRCLLLMQPVIRRELNIDDQQRQKLDTLVEELKATFKAAPFARPPVGVRPPAGGETPEDRQRREANRQQRLEAQTRGAEQSLEILYSAQQSRLEQLYLQSLGPWALLRIDVADSIKLTHRQMQTFKTMTSPPLYSTSFVTRTDKPEEIQAKVAKQREEAQERLEKFEKDAFLLLTDEQRAAWEELIGAKFRFLPTP